jgi:hypothetical protein
MTKPSELFVSQSLSSYDFCEPTEGNYLIRFSYYPKGSNRWGVALSSPNHAQEGLRNFATEKQAQQFVDGLVWAFNVAKLPHKVLCRVHEEEKDD